MPFSSSIWHALWILGPAALITFITLLCVFKGGWYFFDPKHNIDERLKEAGDFEPHCKRYQDLVMYQFELS